MAITCITGIPRSGKSYYCVYLLYKTFIHVEKETGFSRFLNRYIPKKLSKKYDYAYTNINQFDFSKSDKIKRFYYDLIYSHLTLLHEMYLCKQTDDELVAYAKEHNLLDVVFIIDECQNYFDKGDEVLTWWFTYHGHLHQDIMLITQNFDLIFSGYTKLGEFFYKAVPPSSRLFSSKFRYIQYNSYKCYTKDKIGDFLVPMVPEVFSMYVSGAKNDAPSQVKKYLMYALFLSIITAIFFYYFLSMFEPEKPKSSPTMQNNNHETTQPSKQQSSRVLPASKAHLSSQDNDDNKTMLFDIKCISGLCRYRGVDFPRPLLTKVMRDAKPSFVSVVDNASYKQFYLMLPKNTFDFLQNEDEKNPNKDDKNGANSKIPTLAMPFSK